MVPPFYIWDAVDVVPNGGVGRTTAFPDRAILQQQLGIDGLGTKGVVQTRYQNKVCGQVGQLFVEFLQERQYFGCKERFVGYREFFGRR